MIRPMDLLRRLSRKPAAPKTPAAKVSAFDHRLTQLNAVRPVSVSRAVLFRTRPAHQEA